MTAKIRCPEHSHHILLFGRFLQLHLPETRSHPEQYWMLKSIHHFHLIRVPHTLPYTPPNLVHHVPGYRSTLRNIPATVPTYHLNNKHSEKQKRL